MFRRKKAMDNARELMRISFLADMDGKNIKVVMYPGDTVELSYSKPTDEGFAFGEEIYEYDGDTLYASTEYGGRDCDGYLSRFGKYYCKTKNIKRGQYPPFESIGSSVYDEYAQMMGY